MTTVPSWSGRYVRRVSAMVAQHHGRVCYWCKRIIPGGVDRRSPRAFTVEHLVPRSVCLARGLDPETMSNLRPAHRGCNQWRGLRPAREAFALIAKGQGPAWLKAGPAPPADPAGPGRPARSDPAFL